MFSACPARSRLRRSSQGSASAAAVLERIASTVPELILAPNSSSISSTASPRETRFRTEIVATAACSRGPKQLEATSSGSAARVRPPHSGQHTR
jgi:hypothetical protein